MSSARVHVHAYFDFLCPWCYIGKIRLERAIRQAHVSATIEWTPIELYAHHDNHYIHREHIQGNEHLDKIYQQLALVAAEERIVIRQHPYEKSSRRALTGILFAREHGKIDEYMRDVFAEVFEYGNDISSLMVLGRIALKLGWEVETFLRFIDEPKNQNQMTHESEQAKHSGVHGVPTYVINGYTLAGTIPSHELAQLLRTHAHEVEVKKPLKKAKAPRPHALPKKKKSPKKSPPKKKTQKKRPKKPQRARKRR